MSEVWTPCKLVLESNQDYPSEVHIEEVEDSLEVAVHQQNETQTPLLKNVSSMAALEL